MSETEQAHEERTDWPEPPRTVRMAVGGALATALAAGPVTYLLIGAAALVQDWPSMLDNKYFVSTAIEFLFYAAIGGLIGSIPAATVNTLFLGWLAGRGKDTQAIAVASGMAIGFAVGEILLGVLPGDDLAGFVAVRFVFSVTGGLMGALHWRIAIRPRRRWRLFRERQSAAIRAME